VSRRLPVLVAAVGCLAASSLPALAQTVDDTKVAYVVDDGTRQFSVTEVDGTTPLADFTFDSTRTKPFRTKVADSNRLLDSNGYQVSAQLTNLYRVEGAGHDYDSVIRSQDLSLSYGATPLAGTATLPVVPEVRLQGVIGDCTSPVVASALGLGAPLSGLLDPALSLLDPALQSVCTQLGNLSPAARTVDVVVAGAARAVTAPLDLTELPFALTGAQQGGPFTNPSYLGPIASGDPDRTGAAAATTKRIMTGEPLLGTGNVSALLAELTAALDAQLAGAAKVAGDATGVTALSDAVAAISGENAPLASVLTGISSVTDRLELVQTLTATLQTVTADGLSTVTAQYDAYPVLKANPVASRQGTYEGTLVVDFFETS